MNKTTQHKHNINNGTVHAELTRWDHGGADFWLFPHGAATTSNVSAVRVGTDDVSIHWGPSIYRYDYAGQANALTIVGHFFSTMSLGRTANFVKREATLRTKDAEAVA